MSLLCSRLGNFSGTRALGSPRLKTSRSTALTGDHRIHAFLSLPILPAHPGPQRSEPCPPPCPGTAAAGGPSLPPLTSAAPRRAAKATSTVTAESQGHLFVFHRVDHLCTSMLGARKRELNPGAFGSQQLRATPVFPERTSPMEPCATHHQGFPLSLSVCLCPSLSASQAAPPRPPRQPCLQTGGRRGALIKTRRAPHPPKGSIPAEGWASGWRGHPRLTTDSPPAARSPMAALPRPPAAPPRRRRHHTARGERPRRGSRGLSPGDAAGLSRHGPEHHRPPAPPPRACAEPSGATPRA